MSMTVDQEIDALRIKRDIVELALNNERVMYDNADREERLENKLSCLDGRLVALELQREES